MLCDLDFTTIAAFHQYRKCQSVEIRDKDDELKVVTAQESVNGKQSPVDNLIPPDKSSLCVSVTALTWKQYLMKRDHETILDLKR